MKLFKNFFLIIFWVLFVSNAVFASGIIIRDGAVLEINHVNIDLNCNDLVVEDGGRVKITNAVINKCRNLEVAPDGIFSHAGGEVLYCRKMEVIILKEDSLHITISSGRYVRLYGSSGINTVNLESNVTVEFLNFIGANEINIEEASSEFTVYRSGATVYLKSTAGTSIKIPATLTPQTLRFANGSMKLTIITGNVMLGNQLVDTTERLINSSIDEKDTSKNIF